MRNIILLFEHVLLKLELLIVTIENVVKAGGVSKLTKWYRDKPSLQNNIIGLSFKEKFEFCGIR